ncbi:RNA polymerase sigma factor [Flavivirga jejuensis]|uniref:RNA polymerase sigma factor n=1 Tax=Flavivirga jejuensis TaxID=870487 RepID=A0ABT8WLK6_9FLAO|nr:RNA polymerase sigma factor [Flavivirga jejuensis]MDO5974045.1 RNA polymerase sigma factor [Flavivirga jejuensis]
MGTYENSIDYLWKSFLNGDDKSFSLIYQHHTNALLEYGYKLCYDHELVHDSLQEIFIDLFLRRKKNRVTIKNLKSYLFVSLRNSLIKKMTNSRKFESLIDKKNTEINFNVEYSHQVNLINNEISKEVSEKLGKGITLLPSKQKEIIYLKFEEGMDYSEISNIMKISVESARKLMYRALLSLRKTLDPELFNIFILIFFKKKQIKMSMF